MTEPLAKGWPAVRKVGPVAALIALVASGAVFGTVEVVTVVLACQPYVSAVLGLVIVCYIIHRLLCCSAQYTSIERFGMGMTAAGMVMATPALWMADTPFDGWSFNVARVGIAIYIVTGGLRRDRHRSRNLAQAAYWEGFQDGRARGKGV